MKRVDECHSKLWLTGSSNAEMSSIVLILDCKSHSPGVFDSELYIMFCEQEVFVAKITLHKWCAGSSLLEDT